MSYPGTVKCATKSIFNIVFCLFLMIRRPPISTLFPYNDAHPISHSFTVNYGQIVAIGATVLISWLNYIGVRRAGEFQFLFTLLKVAIIIGIVAVGFSYGGGTWANFATE